MSEMDLMKEGQSISRPPLLDGTTYDDWKVRMCVYIKSLDIKVWRSVLTEIIMVSSNQDRL